MLIPTTSQSFARRLRILFAIAIVTVSIYYVWRALAVEIDQLEEIAYSIDALKSMFLAAGATGTLMLSVAYHVLEVARLESHNERSARVAQAYTLGQIARYVPGKVVGIMFQVQLLNGRVKARAIMVALLVQTAADYAWALTFGGVILAAYLLDSVWPLLAMPALVIALREGHANMLFERMIFALPYSRRLVGQPEGSLESRRPAWLITSVLATVWLPLMFGIAGAFSNMMSFTDGLVVATVYIVAIVASLAVVVVPSGLIVREAAFVAIGTTCGFSAPLLLFVGILARLMLTLAELFSAMVCILWAAVDNHRERFVDHTTRS